MARYAAFCLVAIVIGVMSVETTLAGETVDVYMVVRETTTPVGACVSDTLPVSIAEVLVGTSYVVEVWMQDTWGEGLPGGPSPGLTGGEFDLHYDTSLSDAAALHYEGPFNWLDKFLSGEIVEASGVVDDFGCGTILADVAVTPAYARLGYITFDACTAGAQDFTLADKKVARYGLGNVDQGDIELHNASIMQVVPEPSTALLLAVGAAGLLFRRRR